MHILAKITPKPEHLEKAREAIIAILERTRAEIGCHRFDAFVGPDKNCIFLIEHWADKAAFDAHHAQDYTRAVFRSYEAWLAEPAEILELSKIG